MKRSGFKPRKESMRTAYARRMAEKGFQCQTAPKPRSTLKRPTGPAPARKAGLKRTPMRKVSAKRQKEGKIYSQRRKEFLTENWKCQVGTAHCSIHATDVHHKAQRTGTNYLDVSTWLATCRPCHDWIHQHGHQARELGLLV